MILMGSLSAAVILGAMALASSAEAKDAVIIAAGDIARCGSPGHGKTAKIISKMAGTVLAVGDLAYEAGSPKEFRDCYEPTWGKFKDRTRPAPGNHEYRTDAAGGYFSYWGKRAGLKGKGYYSFDLEQWHVVALNSNLQDSAKQEQNTWLAADLERNKRRCILAFWHHPLFSSSSHGDNPKMRDIAKTLFAKRASVILAGHDHVYERFYPQSPTGKQYLKRGIRMFTVGTGGASLYSFKSTHPNSQVRYNGRPGVLKLVLKPTSYKWEFINTKGQIKDQGDANCV